MDSPARSGDSPPGAWINLFNLLPVWQLDGNRGFTALARSGRLAVAPPAVRVAGRVTFTYADFKRFSVSTTTDIKAAQ